MNTENRKAVPNEQQLKQRVQQTSAQSSSSTQPILNQQSSQTTPINSTTSQPPQTTNQNKPPQRLPSDITLQNACKLSITEDKPIMLDYWVDSIERRALIGVKEDTNEKILVKSAEEYTSPIAKLYRSGTEIIIVTENSIYLVVSDIQSRKIT